MENQYALVQRPRTKNTDIIRRMIGAKDEWYFIATVISTEIARDLVRLLNLGGQVAEQEHPPRKKKSIYTSNVKT